MRVLVVMALTLMALSGCGKSQGSSTTGPIPIGSGNGDSSVLQHPLIGYGLPNGWDFVEPHAFAKLLRDYGLGQTVIELHPRNKVVKDALWASFILVMRSEGIHTHVVVVNWNCRSANGGCPTAEEVGALTDRLRATVGTSRVSIEVSEPSSAFKEQRSITLARQAWTGEFMVNWGFPFPPGLQWETRSIHECDSNPSRWAIRSDVLHLTDCGSSLTRNAREITAFARQHDQRIILYDFSSLVPDLNVLAEMREALR